MLKSNNVQESMKKVENDEQLEMEKRSDFYIIKKMIETGKIG